MKHTNRILCTVLAVVLLVSVMLTGCTLPKPTLTGTGNVAATYGDTEISTGEYLAHLYLNFSQVYQSYYYYEQYGLDPWEQTIPYGEDDEKLALADYIVQITKDSIKRQIVLEQMMEEKGLSWIEDEKKDVDKELAELQPDLYLALGFSNENFAKVYQALCLNERAVFMGLYGKGGLEEVKETELKKYFDENYLSYKGISANLTDSEGKELSKEKKQEELDKMNAYLKIAKEKGFEAAVDKFNKDKAGKDEKVEASKEEDNRMNSDATTMDENLAKAIRSLKINEMKVVEYKAGGSTPSAVLLQRLDPSKPSSVYEDAYEDILSSLKYEDFNKAVEEKAAALDITFNEKVVKKCDPKNFTEAQ